MFDCSWSWRFSETYFRGFFRAHFASVGLIDMQRESQTSNQDIYIIHVLSLKSQRKRKKTEEQNGGKIPNTKLGFHSGTIVYATSTSPIESHHITDSLVSKESITSHVTFGKSPKVVFL